MKKKRIFLALAIFVVLLIGVLFKNTVRKVPVEKTLDMPEANSTHLTNHRANQNQSPPDSAMAHYPNKSTNTHPAGQINNWELEYLEKFKKGTEARNVNINFWGQVIDQDNQPLSGAIVHINATKAHWFSEENEPGIKESPYSITTDANGLFELRNVTGIGVNVIHIEKDDYELSPTVKRYFGYAPSPGFVPDPQNPVVFRMWKKMGAAERLILQNRHIRIPYDGTPAYFDLFKGAKVTSNDPNDIEVILLRTPLKVSRGGKEKYDWTAQVVGVGGGLIVTTNEFMNLAPETGYTPSFNIEMSKENPDWSTHKTVSFFLKSREKYGRVTLEFRTDSDRETTGFTFNSAINPSGSRNLEYDPKVYLAPWAK